MTPLESWGVVVVFVFGGAYAITAFFSAGAQLVEYVNRVGWRGAAEALVGGAYLITAATLTAVLAPFAAVFSDKQAEAEDKLAEAVTKKPYHEQSSGDPRPGKTIEIDFDAPLEDSPRRIEECA